LRQVAGPSPGRERGAVPLDWYERNLEVFTDELRTPSGANGKHVRRAAALKLVEMTAGGSWADCARALGMPRGYASTSLSLLRDRCPSDATWQLFQSGVEAIATELDANPNRIDYGHRRRTLSTWSIPEDHWTELVHGLSDSLTRPQVRMAASVLVWTQATKGEAQLSPLIGLGGTGPRVPDAAELGREINKLIYIPARSQRVLRERLAQYAAQAAAHCDRSPSLTPKPALARP